MHESLIDSDYLVTRKNMNSNNVNDTNVQVLQGGGFTGELIRSIDWSRTSLGDFNEWPHSLQSALGICINSNFPIAIYWGPELVLIYNDAWSPIPGNKHPWAMGKTANEVWPDIWSDIEPQFEKAFKGKPGGSKDALLPMQRHGYTEECYFDFTFTPIYGDTGKVEGIFNAVIETTYRVINERRANILQNLASKISALQSVEDIVKVTCEVLDTARTDIPFYLLYTAADGLNSKPTASSGNFRGKVLKQWPVQNSGKGFGLLVKNLNEYLSETPYGTWPEKPTQAFVAPLIGSDGNSIGQIVFGISARLEFNKEYQSFFESIVSMVSRELITIFSLIEERKRAKVLAEIDKAKTIFFSNISHEFRTPLTLMLSPLQSVIEAADYLDGDHKNDLEISLRNTRRLQKLVNTLLDFSRIEAGKMEAKFEVVDIGEHTEDIASSFRSAIENAGLKYNVSIGQIDSLVAVDIDMWEKIVLNLISNAFKYTNEGSIEVSLRERDGKIVLTVKDTGLGIAESDQEKIFERFYRVNNSDGRSQEGTGIGLSLVKELVSLHHGQIKLKTQLNHGSEFTVTIPVNALSNVSEKTPRAETSHLRKAFAEEVAKWNGSSDGQSIQDGFANNGKFTATGNKPKVLLADDNADMVEYIDRLLSSDFLVRTVNNGEDAYSTAIAWQPDIILSDIMMPKLDGYGLLNKLKSTLVTRNIPVIFLSARAGEESRIEGIKAGADDYLVKPFSAKELVARVNNHFLISKTRRTTEKQFYNLFLQSPAHIHVMRGPEHVMEFFHPLGKEFLGGRDITGMKIREALPEIEGQGYFEMLDQVYREGKPEFLPESKAVIQRNGKPEEFYFNISYLPWRDLEGNIQGVLQFTFDVTQQAKANLKIRESEERFRLLATSISQIIWIADIKGNIEYLSDQWEKYTGLTIAEGVEQFSSLIHKDDVDDVRAKWKTALELGAPWQAEFRLLDTRTNQYAWFAGHTLPLKDENGKVIKWIGSSSNIQSQKEVSDQLSALVAEKTADLNKVNETLKLRNNELFHTQNFLQTVLNSSVEMIASFDKDLRYTFVNDKVEQLMNLPAEKLVGKKVTEAHPGIDKTDIYDMLQRALRGETIHSQQRASIFTEGRTLESFCVPYRKDEEILGVITMHRDITSFIRLTEDLRRSNSDLQQFAHVTSHDLKEPVRKIKLYSDLIKTNFESLLPEKGKSYLSKIENSTNRISAMIDGVLQYSSIDELHQGYLKIDLNSILKDIVDDLEIPISEKNATIKIDDLPAVIGSKTLIYQLFYNLFNNSLKFARQNVSLLISVKADKVTRKELPNSDHLPEYERYHRIAISDNGIGFDQSYSEKIFESFLRLNPKDKFEGTGLGLSLCKKIVDRHNGFITASGKVNEGATFTVYLPVRKSKDV
jgi:PAS domain S-box-containing protein